jgi:glycosyltransferase involved in cell wall biosynthesis
VTAVSVIATVRNEETTVDDLIRSLLVQTRRPAEIVISDGGSTDGTIERIRRWSERDPSIRLVETSDTNIAAGRNRAIATATGSIIACTDAGARLDPRWLENLVAPFAEGADVVMGFFVAAPQTLFERALGAATLPDVDEIRPERFVPSSRSIAFTRVAWEGVGGYPEWLDYCEDVVFDLALRRAGLRFAWAPNAVVYYRPRASVRAYFRQYFLYARGDGQANLWPKRHAVRYATYLSAPLVAALGFWYKRAWLALALGAVAYLWTPLRRLARATDGVPAGERVRAFAYLPVLRLVGDVAKMIGYPVGVWWRIRREWNDG